jgi:hypothetical protein
VKERERCKEGKEEGRRGKGKEGKSIRRKGTKQEVEKERNMRRKNGQTVWIRKVRRRGWWSIKGGGNTTQLGSDGGR